jgi:phosphatidyl-myo-inositol dimannoside synthase
MKILYITNHLNGNDGWSRYSLDIINKVIKTNNILCLIGKKAQAEKKYEKVIPGNPLEYLANPIKSFLVAREVNKFINNFSPDIIHFMAEPYITMLPFLRIKKRIKIILTIHGTYAYFPNLIDSKLKKIISLYLFKISILKIDKIISVSEFTKDYLLKNIENDKFKKFIEKKIVVITNGINTDNINLTKRKNKDSGANIKNILFVGAIKSRKGVLESVESLRVYRDEFSDNFVYNIVGSYKEGDTYYKRVINKIREYKLDNNIFFRGRVSDEDLESYYQKSDLFLMLPINDGRRFEGFGLVYLEANARGIPCIGSNDSGAKEAILDDKTGYTINQKDPLLVAKKIDLILNKKEIKQGDCFNWAKENSVKNKAGIIIDLYKG